MEWKYPSYNKITSERCQPLYKGPLICPEGGLCSDVFIVLFSLFFPATCFPWLEEGNCCRLSSHTQRFCCSLLAGVRWMWGGADNDWMLLCWPVSGKVSLLYRPLPWRVAESLRRAPGKCYGQPDSKLNFEKPMGKGATFQGDRVPSGVKSRGIR